ncbi:biogenesis of lysosome-related organelles complex 1 subunit 5-like isoform X1 [Clavelina lepadiformis]|uniref:biogenesis of lysosome-related organelles complex 1 subunit 5-like isoform X1 n=1 Tax=Clavelina lepadiformis TaxID=159417 RepID=UPI00404298C5
MEVISRLFNHRPAIQGEISYFVRQFEDKKNKDDELINDIWVNSRNLSEKILPLSLDLAAHNFTQIQAKVLVCCQMCEKISSQENSPINIENKSESESEEDFRHNISEQKHIINKEYDEAVMKLLSEYEAMEKQVERENSTAFEQI